MLRHRRQSSAKDLPIQISFQNLTNRRLVFFNRRSECDLGRPQFSFDQKEIYKAEMLQIEPYKHVYL